MNARTKKHKIFSIYQNIKSVFENNKQLDNIEILVSSRWFNSTYQKIKFYAITCDRIYNEMENVFYDFNDLILYYLYSYMFADKVSFEKANYRDIIHIKKLFTTQQIELDKETFKQIFKSYGDINKLYFFKLNENGSTKIVDLILERKLSPAFWYKCRTFFDMSVHDFKENDTHKKFRKIMKLIEIYLRKEPNYG